MSTKEEHDLARSIISEELVPVFLQMLKESEGRIDTTNRMVSELANAIAKNQTLCTDLMRTAEKSQYQVTELIKANIEQTKLMEQNREDFRITMQGYRDELQSAKQMIHELLQTNTRITEEKGHKSAGSSARNDININT